METKSCKVSADEPLKPSLEKQEKKKKHLKPQRHWTTGCYHIPSTSDNDISAKLHMKQKRRSSMASTSACHNDPMVDNHKPVYNWWDLSNALELDSSFTLKKKPLPTCTEMENESTEESVEDLVDESFKKSSQEKETDISKLQPQSNLGIIAGSHNVPLTTDNGISSPKSCMKQKRRSSMASTCAHHNTSTVDYNA